MIYAKTTVLRSPIKIDALVYQLYGLSDEEIKIVEGEEKEKCEVVNKKGE